MITKFDTECICEAKDNIGYAHQLNCNGRDSDIKNKINEIIDVLNNDSE